MADAASRARVTGRIRQEIDKGNSPVVVVSAMGRRGAPYATDTLLDLVPGAQPDISALIVSCGEIISACIVANNLNAKGIPAKALTAYSAGIKAKGPYDGAVPAEIMTENLEVLIKAGFVPVVTGFQGVLPDSSIATLGRGGSDTTAVALGAWLHAEYVDIFTDVPGVAMADPRIVPEAPFIPYLDYESMVRLSGFGSKVLQDVSARIAMEKKVRVRIRSTFDDSPGTVIGPDRDKGHADLAGIAVKEKDADTSIVTIVYKAGAGKGQAEKIAERLNAKVIKSCRYAESDPDAVILELPKAQVKETLQTILAPYIKTAE